jgi:hypothetical protein
VATRFFLNDFPVFDQTPCATFFVLSVYWGFVTNDCLFSFRTYAQFLGHADNFTDSLCARQRNVTCKNRPVRNGIGQCAVRNDVVAQRRDVFVYFVGDNAPKVGPAKAIT